MDLPARILACMGCLKSRGLLGTCEKDDAGRCLCPETRRAFYSQATAGICPVGKFPAEVPDLPRWQEPEAMPAEGWRLDSAGNAGCGCKK